MVKDLHQPSLRHLRVFQKVAELQGIRKAAEAVSLSQPAVTQAIEKLEAQTGTRLFERRSRGTYLTEAGDILFGRVKMMSGKIDAALVDLGIGGGRAGSVEGVAHRVTRQQIKVLAAISSSCSFADAARKLGISPVSLHKAARELERNLGKPIFNEMRTGFVATRAGSEFARKASLALREIDWAMEEISAAEGRLGGELRIGAMPLSGVYLLGLVLNDVENYFPYANIRIKTAGGVDLTNALRLGEIDFIVGINRDLQCGEEIVHEPLLSTPFVLVGRRDHPLSRKGQITPADLMDYRWVTPNRNAARRAVFDRLFAGMSAPPDPVIEANALSTIRMLVSGSDRLTLLTKFEFEFEKSAGDLVMLPFPEMDSGHSLAVARRGEWAPTGLHRTFMKLLHAKSGSFWQSEAQCRRHSTSLDDHAA